MPDEIPEWVSFTPRSATYDLSMYEPGGGGIQTVDMDRAKYLALKAKLAEMRGYPPAETEEE